MHLRNLPFSLDAHLQSPFDATADLCEVEVLRNNIYLREMKAPENSLRARMQQSPKPSVEYFFTQAHGLESIAHVENGGIKKEELSLTKEGAERAYQLLDAVVASLNSSSASKSSYDSDGDDGYDDALLELLAAQGYHWEGGKERITKSVDYDEKKMISALRSLKNGKDRYFNQQQLIDSQQIKQELPDPENFFREDLSNGSTRYTTHQKAYGRYFSTVVVVRPALISPAQKGWYLEGSVTLEGRSVPLARMEEYCLHLDEISKDLSTLVKLLGYLCQKYLEKGDIKARPENKHG